MKYLIVAADDFGMTKSMNEGIVKAYKEGIVTSINFMPSGEAFEDARTLAMELKLKEIGGHLALTETSPVAEPDKVSSLVTRGNRFRKDYISLILDLFFKRIREDEIYIELKSQLGRLKALGIKIAYLSSHEHIHMRPDILKIFVELAKEHGIPSIRCIRREKISPPYSVKKIYRTLTAAYFDKRMRESLDTLAISHADNFRGFLDSGSLNESNLINICKSLDDGITELVCHPGFLGPEVLDRYRFHINCEYELYALTSPRVKKIIKEQNINLINYSEFL
ncbi:MAG: hypothetical protein A2987_04190 [Omnitrophica bacterium RIFCSPLOWO2_01_FULL_45_10]|nr:MAG: hypothetical protein A2987_04190 [Omnitrophica bacterium RIFCSPLOWO2_01_FULL_45_10]